MPRKNHYLKTWPDGFQAVKSGKKTFECRADDRDYEPDDQLTLAEYDPREQQFTGRMIYAQVLRIDRPSDLVPIPDGYCIMSIALKSVNL